MITLIVFDQGFGYVEIEPDSVEGRWVIGPCVNCRYPFLFNADTVPSIRISLATGKPNPAADEPSEKFPCCNACIARGNARRVELGKDPFPLGRDSSR